MMALPHLSQYKNLVHRYYHSRGEGAASTLWADCGAVERTLFLALGGFDVKRYPYPSIENIELGYRVLDLGRKIVLRADLEGKHLKEWRLKNLLHTDVFRRAIPWSGLMLERKQLTNDLNVGIGERVRALLGLGSVAALLVWATDVIPTWRGVLFAARAFLYHQFYYVYSLGAFAYASLRHVVSGSRARAAAWRHPTKNRGAKA